MIEGYWNNSNNDCPEYPMPVPNVLSQDDADHIADMIERVQGIAVEHRYRGFSQSRITDECLGCVEYEHGEWIWPGDFASHYVRQHRVRPSNAFMDFITECLAQGQ